MWTVQPASAAITSSNNGSAWDGDGSAPDPYVTLTCPAGSTTQTPADSDTLNPTWTTGGCTAKASDLLSQPIVFQVFDQDAISDDTITPQLQFQFTDAMLSAGTAQGACVAPSCQGGLTSISFQLTKQ